MKRPPSPRLRGEGEGEGLRRRFLDLPAAPHPAAKAATFSPPCGAKGRSPLRQTFLAALDPHFALDRIGDVAGLVGAMVEGVDVGARGRLSPAKTMRGFSVTRAIHTRPSGPVSITPSASSS